MTEASYYDNITAETLNFTHVFEVGLIGQSPITGIQMTIAIPAALRLDGKRVPLLRIREPMVNSNSDIFKQITLQVACSRHSSVYNF